MLDGAARKLIDPLLTRAGSVLGARGVSADALTLVGLLCGLAACTCVVFQLDAVALLLFALNRICDGLDGAVAAATRRTDRGGFLDIVCDFVFYGAFPLAFALRDPALALPTAVLLTSFYINGATFLAYAALAAKRGLSSDVRGQKSIYFTAGLAEGTETIACFLLMLLFPAWFAALAYVFAAMVLVTALSRAIIAWTTFRP
jgi:phosphatidylglycerophosphate synthase